MRNVLRSETPILNGPIETGERELNMRGTTEGKSIQASGSPVSSPQPSAPGASEILSRDLANQLLGLMKQVTAKEVSPGTVNAACACASEIHKILKLNFQMKMAGL